jgi:hypothetical protein
MCLRSRARIRKLGIVERFHEYSSCLQFKDASAHSVLPRLGFIFERLHGLARHPSDGVRLDQGLADQLVPARVQCVSRLRIRVRRSPMMTGSIGLLERPFTPDGAKDLGDVWARDPQAIGGQIPSQKTRLAKPNAMMFFHIPLYSLFLRCSGVSADRRAGPSRTRRRMRTRRRANR